MNEYTLEITTMIGCPLMCTYCPQDTLRTAYGNDVKYMSLSDFKTIIDKVPKHVRLDFSGQAEPWVNPECTDMFEYAVKSGFRTAIFTTLYNWDEATVHRMGELLLNYSKQVDIFKIHFPDAEGNMRGWKITPEWEYAFTGMTTVVRSAGIHYEAMAMSNTGVHPDIRHLMGVGVSHGWFGHDRAGTLDQKQVEGKQVARIPKHVRPVKCRKTDLYNQGVLLPNGDVLLCCMDYKKQHVMGNLLTGTYDSIYTGPEMQRLKELNALADFTNESLCKSCTDAIYQ